ncbi:MAG: cyclodeaminase/cyclohydrolase family protein [Planctomycetes bacterium]|nr:cyclodeaminase/cyclohydrolase family protein [Planctomycetota bacterium]
MDDLAQLTLDGFLDRVAARTPAPGGGAVAAAAGASACALARMVVAYSASEKSPPDSRARALALAEQLGRADQCLRALVTEDGRVYSAMTAAGKAAKSDPAGEEPYARAVLAAAGVPLQMVAVLSNVLALLDDFRSEVNRHLLSDLAVVAAVAASSATAAACMVRVNLPQIADEAVRDRLAGECHETLGHASAAADRLQRFVTERLH